MSKVIAFSEENESGATAIEYGLIAAGISVVIIATVNAIGSSLNAKFDRISTQLKWHLHPWLDSKGAAVMAASFSSGHAATGKNGRRLRDRRRSSRQVQINSSAFLR